MDTLRRGQCLNLARAFDVAVPAGATKEELLPILISAERQGKFKGSPKDYRALARALQNPDDGPHPRPWELVGMTEDVWTRADGGGPASEGGVIDHTLRKVYPKGTRQWMQRRLREYGVKYPFGTKNDELKRLLTEAGEDMGDADNPDAS